MSTATDHPACPDAVDVAAEVSQVIDRYALALAATPERACATPEELAALGQVVAWIAGVAGDPDPRARLRLLALSALERAARVHLEATPVPTQAATDSWVFDPRPTVRPADEWGASTVAALLTIRANGGPLALDAALATVVEHAGPTDLWSLLTEAARTWGHLLSTDPSPTGRVPAT